MAMLERFAGAGDWGIDRWFVPVGILYELQTLGYVTKLDAKPMITEAGRAALSSMKESDNG